MMSLLIFFFALAPVFPIVFGSDQAGSAGCAPGKRLPKGWVAGQASHNVTFVTSEKVQRTYLIHIPRAYRSTTPAPLIFSFHGRTEHAEDQESQSQFSVQDWDNTAIAVYPQGLGHTPQWQGDPTSHGVDDVAFVSQLLSHLEERYCVDTSRIYASGKSNGGGMTNVLACDPNMSKRIAAFAIVAGALYTDHSTHDCDGATVAINNCSPGRARIPVLEIHGKEDHTIEYAGGVRRKGCLPSIPNWATQWAVRDGLGATNQSSTLSGGQVTEYVFGRSQTVVTYHVGHMGHEWPSPAVNGAPIDATPVVLDWFKKWSVET